MMGQALVFLKGLKPTACRAPTRESKRKVRVARIAERWAGHRAQYSSGKS